MSIIGSILNEGIGVGGGGGTGVNSNTDAKLSTQSILNALHQSLNGFTLNELRNYSILLLCISSLGLVCHTIVFGILIYQQVQRALMKRSKSNSLLPLNANNGINTSRLNFNENLIAPMATGASMSSTPSSFALPSSPSLASKLAYKATGKGSNVEEFPMDTYALKHSHNHHHQHHHRATTTTSTRDSNVFRPNQNLLNHNQQQYNNYVTYAFVFHQTLVDLMRLVYCIFYANNVFFDYKKYLLIRDNLDLITGTNLLEQEQTILKNYSSNDLSYQFSSLYENYCIQMASFYSVLTMVTIVNILTILISETCRFYDLKLNSSDTSNYCCVLFGILLIWTSSLIIISSLMLVGVADSAAPTWKCNLAETESTTRSLVINVVWFFLVAFVVLISFSYSYSLYKELKKIDTEDSRFSLYTINASLMAFKSELLERQIKIVKQTKKRLFILVMLIVIYCVTFVPNFVTTILKNTLYASTNADDHIRPFNLIFSILALANPTLNSLVLLFLCVKSDDNYLNEKCMGQGGQNGAVKMVEDGVKLVRGRSIVSRLASMFSIGSKQRPSNVNYTNQLSGDEGDDDYDEEASRPLNVKPDNELGVTYRGADMINMINGKRDTTAVDDIESCLIYCNEECLQIKNAPTINGTGPQPPLQLPQLQHSVLKPAHPPSLSHQNSLNQTNVKEFYSKIGNRLGNLN